MLPEHRGSMSVTSHSITASSPSRVDMQVVWYGTCIYAYGQYTMYVYNSQLLGVYMRIM